MDPIKGHTVLIDAFRLVVARHPNARLVLVGDGTQQTAIRQQISDYGIHEHVVIMGHRTDVHRIMHAMDVFVLASLNEGMGRVLLEAMACGQPVIATAVGGVPEIVDHGTTGWLVEPRNPRALAEAMMALASDDARRREMADHARRSVTDHLSLNTMVRHIDDLYQSLSGEQ
jgi:glycosyltransferase involved in cell wall biosynthesis